MRLVLRGRIIPVATIFAVPAPVSASATGTLGVSGEALACIWRGVSYLYRMPEPDEPTRDELPEIGRRLCGLLGVKPREPITASSLRIVADEQNAVLPRERWPVLYAIRICADAMAEQALPD